MVAITLSPRDPTLDEIQRLYSLKLVKASAQRAKRKAKGAPYIGASKIGHECDRHIYFDAIGAPQDAPHHIWGNSGILAAEDGHRSEPIMAKRLRMVKGIELYTHDDAGKQYGFNYGFMRGAYDGVILGLLQAPLTPHVWDHKRANAKKFNKLVKLVQADEKSALQQWDSSYYAQQVIYMESADLTRNYLTCSTDGFSDVTSVRTNADAKFAKALINKARRIVESTRAPAPISKKDTVMPCLFCSFKGFCRSQP